MDNFGSDSFLNNPESHTIPMSTAYLRDAFPERFEERKVKERFYYLEKPLENSKRREYRYLAYISDSGNLNPKEGLARLYEKGGNVWERNFTDDDIEEIGKAITLIKVAVNSDDMAKDNFDRDATMSNGSSITVEYVPYISDNSDSVTEDLV